MSAEVLLIFLIAFLAMAMVGRASGRVDRMPREDDNAHDLTPAAMTGHGRALMRINEAIQIFQENLEPAKLRRGNDTHVRFYLAYIHALARTFAEDDGVPLDDILAAPLTLEIIRLTGPGGVGAGSSADTLERILTSNDGAAGAEAGRLDGIEACAPVGQGPYFQRLRAYFEASATSDRRS